MKIPYITERGLTKHISEEIKILKRGDKSSNIEGELSFNKNQFDVISGGRRYKINDSDMLEIKGKDYEYLDGSSIQ